MKVERDETQVARPRVYTQRQVDEMIAESTILLVRLLSGPDGVHKINKVV